MRKMKRVWLLLAALALAGSVVLTMAGGKTVQSPDFAVAIKAAEIMRGCMERVRDDKAELGLAISPDDLHQTGMIGETYTGITTTNGALEAKRTCANPDMAALAVRLLREAGVESGDTIGAGFSGSFPAMNLAVLSACAAMDVRPVYISSVGASTYGANQPELTFPDMVWRLVEDGLLPVHGAAVSLGGQRDCGLDMQPELVSQIRARLESRPIPLLYEEDFEKNLAARRAIYEREGPITCFVGVGGNLSTIGLGESVPAWGVIAPYRAGRVDEKSGLIQYYSAEGMPVIQLLNIRKLVADYGMPYDPEQLLPPGESAVYDTVQYPWSIAAVGLVLSVGLLLWGRRQTKREEMR